MQLDDPVDAYHADSNTEAFLIQQMLQQAGIDATVTEDISLVGYWFGGKLPEIHKPQVWINRRDTETAGRLLTEYEDRKRQRMAPPAAEPADEIEVVCEDCGARNVFPLTLAGSIQECNRCLSYLDVTDAAPPSGDDVAVSGQEEE